MGSSKFLICSSPYIILTMKVLHLELIVLTIDWLTSMLVNMKTIGVYEAKTKISEICETVKKTHEPVVITKRGIPMVKITSIEDSEEQSYIWEKHKKYTKTNGPISEEITLPSRDIDPIKNISDD